MQSTKNIRWLVILALALSTAGAAFAQEAPFNATMVSNFDQPGQSYADVWGDGDFAYIAHFGSRIVDIIDITDPANPVLAATYDTDVISASAQDVKVAGGLMFVGLEQTSPGCHIVDVRDPYAPVKLTDVTVLSSVHNVFYDDGWLYLVDSSSNQIDIVDLRTYDPDNAPAVISTRQWRMTGVGGQIVHDITVQNGRLYASAWDTIRIYDVSDVANTLPPLLGSASGASVHASWATDDGRFLVVTEEHSTSGMTLYEVLPAEAGGLDLKVRDYHFLSSLRAGSVHNVLIDGLRVYVSWYAAGVQVFEIDPDEATLNLVASFDTSAADGDDSIFAGNWGVYPYLSPDRVLASDGNTGLWVIDVDANVLRFKYPDPSLVPLRGDVPLVSLVGNGPPRTVPPDVAAPIEVEIAAVGAPTDAATVMSHAAVDGGAAADQTLTDQGGGVFAGTLPAAGCGSVIGVSFSADNTLGTSFVDPPGAPAETYRVDVAQGVVAIFEDDFDADFGWTVENTALGSGAWERGDPIGTGAQPENDATGAGDGSCFFTDQGPVGGSIGNSDVDGGPTVLTSPELDFSDAGGIVSYAYWYFNADGGDAMVVEISNDGTIWIEARRYDGVDQLGGWREDRFDTDDFVAASDQIQVRFSVADNGNPTVTEAAIDNFSAYRLECGSLFTDGFESGDTSSWSSTTP